MAPSRKKRDTQVQGDKQRILRIGVILGGNIIEEKLIRNQVPITIGQSAKATFCVPIEGLPKEWTLFAVENGRHVLRFRDGMDGRLSDGGNVNTLSQLREKGAQNLGDHHRVELSRNARGKIVVGSMTLLFQFVTAPPLQPRPRLPASVRGTLADRIEPQLAVIMLLSIVAHLALVIWAYNRDIVETNAIDLRHREFVKDEYVVSTFKEPEIATKSDEPEGGDDEPAPKKVPTPKPANKPPGDDKKPDKDPAPGGDDGAAADAAIEEELAASPLLRVAAAGESEGGRYEEFSNTDSGASLNATLDNVKRGGGKVSAISRGGRRGTRGPTTGRVAAGSGTGRVTGPSSSGVNTGTKVEEKIRSRAKLKVIDVGLDTSLDPGSVTRRIRSRYLPGIKRCHERVLKQNPGAKGKVTISMTVGASGRVTKVSVKGFDPTVDSCIQGLARKWIFGIPKDDAGKPSTASFVIPLLLKPGS